MVKNKNDWPITTERFVAYIDIMGFKDMVARQTTKVIYDLMIKLDRYSEVSAGIKFGDEQLVRKTQYSDSIMLYSKDATAESQQNFISSVSILYQSLLSNCIPHKGSIAFGEMTLDPIKSIYFGQPLIDAYELQMEMHFYGVIVHASADEEMSKIPMPLKPSFIIKHLCCLKNGKAFHNVVIPILFAFQKKR
jgi:hypothetical protein